MAKVSTSYRAGALTLLLSLGGGNAALAAPSPPPALPELSPPAAPAVFVNPRDAAMEASPAAEAPGPAFTEPTVESAPIETSAIQPSRVRVLLGQLRRFHLSGVDLALNASQHFPGQSVLSFQCGRSSNGRAYVEFGSGRLVAEKIEIRSPSGFLHFNGKLYRDTILLLPRAEGCAVVNVLDLEKYLAGLLNREMAPSWPIEALKAQAVASRSYAHFQIRANAGREFDLESTTQDQVYDGASAETPRSSEAVESTRGLVLAYAASTVKAYFHANCGGMTEVPDFVWGGNSGGFRTVACPYHRHKRNQQRWSVRLSKLQIEGALKRVAGLLPKSFLRLAHLEAGAPNASRRLSDVMASDSRGNSVLISANAFRNALGNTKVKSTAFELRDDGKALEIQGQGFGHGVGMCQIGARAMAEQNKTFRDILAYYYPQAKITPLN